jgi:hypothetical protein
LCRRWSASNTATPSAPAHRLAVKRERLRAQLVRGRSDAGIAISPVKAAAGEQLHRLAVAADDQAVAVVLDLVHPAGAGRRLGGKGGNARVDKPISADAAREHPVK